MRSFLVSLLAASAVATVACSFHVGGQTDGAHGNADFSYSNCFLGCTTGTPMMLGDEEKISVSGAIPATVSVVSTSPDVVSVKSAERQCCEHDADGGGTTCRTIALNDACTSSETASLVIVVDAPAEGSSDLLVKKADDSVWDSVTLSVERAASLALACNTKTSVTLAQAATCPVTWHATDKAGKDLMSTAGLHLTTSAPTVATFNGFLVTDQSEIQAIPMILGDVTIVAGQPGDAIVTATGGGATETLAVHVQ